MGVLVGLGVFGGFVEVGIGGGFVGVVGVLLVGLFVLVVVFFGVVFFLLVGGLVVFGFGFCVWCGVVVVGGWWGVFWGFF
ncbi:hypothetical protein WNX13_10305, partial [Lactobacillus delbrueckii]|uniref:hypothetical protein n=1 Tax=Lactobacillus delbrueckii TaxID=1584 RepID=UPI0030E8097C